MRINECKWCRFRHLCREYLLSIRPDDMDYDTMKRVVETCLTRNQVWKIVRAYNETYFRELIQTLEERAQEEIITFTVHFSYGERHPWFTVDASVCLKRV